MILFEKYPKTFRDFLNDFVMFYLLIPIGISGNALYTLGFFDPLRNVY